MDDIQNVTTLPSKETPISKEPSRSVYPSASLTTIFQFVSKIYTDLGYSHYHSKESIAQIHGTTYSNIKTKLSTALQYRLLDLKYGTGYKVTPLFLKLYRPHDDNEKRDGILHALLSPRLYETVITEYHGHNFPSEVGLSTTLFRRYGLNETAAAKAAQVMLFNLNEFGLIGSDGVLNFAGDTFEKKTVSNVEYIEHKDIKESSIAKKELPPSTNAEIINSEYLEIPIPISSGKAYLRVPESASAEDYQKIARIVEAYK